MDFSLKGYLHRMLLLLFVLATVFALCVPFASAISYPTTPTFEEYDLVAVYQDKDTDKLTALYLTKGQFQKFGTAYYNESLSRYEIRAYRVGGVVAYWEKHVYDSDLGRWVNAGGKVQADSQVLYVSSASAMGYAADTITIWGTDGEIFFPTPLWKMTEDNSLAILQGEMIPQTMRTISILALCGVGCLALLISLPLFGKALKRFLG